MRLDRLDQLPDLATVAEVQQLLRTGRRQTYEAVRRGDIPSIRIGRSIRIPRAALERALTRTVSRGDPRNREAPGPHTRTLRQAESSQHK
jgi:excisionase family DNA binding protein